MILRTTLCCIQGKLMCSKKVRGFKVKKSNKLYSNITGIFLLLK